MDIFSGKTLVLKDGSEHAVDKALGDAKVVAVYFSAHWCPPCRMFTPVLAEACRRGREGYSAEVEEIVPEEDATSVISILAVRTDKSTGVCVDVNVASVTATTRVHIHELFGGHRLLWVSANSKACSQTQYN
ncbi:hypothetical protein MRX96_028334 [Rhipicephalus microplus]